MQITKVELVAHTIILTSSLKVMAKLDLIGYLEWKRQAYHIPNLLVHILIQVYKLTHWLYPYWLYL